MKRKMSPRRRGIRAAKKAARDRWAAVRQVVIRREDGLCAVCHRPHDRMNVHHILDRRAFPEIAFDPINLIALCPSCHKFSPYTSAHKCPVYFCEWLKKNRPEQYARAVEYLDRTSATKKD